MNGIVEDGGICGGLDGLRYWVLRTDWSSVERRHHNFALVNQQDSSGEGLYPGTPRMTRSLLRRRRTCRQESGAVFLCRRTFC